MTHNPAFKKLSSVNIFLLANSDMLYFSSYIDFCSYSSHLHLKIVTFKCFMKQTNKQKTYMSFSDFKPLFLLNYFKPGISL